MRPVAGFKQHPRNSLQAALQGPRQDDRRGHGNKGHLQTCDVENATPENYLAALSQYLKEVPEPAPPNFAEHNAVMSEIIGARGRSIMGGRHFCNGSTLQTDASVTIRPLMLILLNGLAKYELRRMFSPKRETIGGGLAGAFEKHRKLVDL